MKKTILFFLLTCSTIELMACANTFYSVNSEGKAVSWGYGWEVYFYKKFNLEKNASKLKRLEKKLKVEKNYMLLSDYTVSLMKLGKEKEALEILIELYKHYPNDYIIAANLGTAYELNGQVDSALKYIKRDISLNPNDHEGSEWIHVKVLETKLALQKDPAYLSSHTVLNLTEKQKKDSTVLNHLTIQLQERVPFTPRGTNPIMVSLFTDLAELSANINSIEYARVFYQLAKEYYGGDPAVLDAKMKEMKELNKRYANVKLKDIPDGLDRWGPPARINGISYKQLLLDDNYLRNYKVNWDKINTDVSSLLAMVDFTKSSPEVKSLAKQVKDTAAEGFTLMEEKGLDSNAIDRYKVNDSVVKFHGFNEIAPVNDEGKGIGAGMYLLFIFLSVAAIAIIWYFIQRGQRE